MFLGVTRPFHKRKRKLLISQSEMNIARQKRGLRIKYLVLMDRRSIRQALTLGNVSSHYQSAIGDRIKKEKLNYVHVVYSHL